MYELNRNKGFTMIFKRRKLGPTYTRSPVQNIREGATTNFSKILFAIAYSAGFLVVLYVFVGVIVFLGIHFSDMWEEGTTTLSVFNSPYCLPWKVGGVIGVFLYVFKDNLTKR